MSATKSPAPTARADQPSFRLRLRPRGEPISSRTLLGIILAAAGIWSIAATGFSNNLHARGWRALSDILLAAFTPDLSLSYLKIVGQDALTTVAYGVMSIVLASVIGVIGALLASGLLFTGKIPSRTPGQSQPPRNQLRRSLAAAATALSRAILAVLRGIHELVWALLFVAGFGLSPWVGVLAIALPYGAIMARIFADQLNDVPTAPVAMLRAAGASRPQLIAYGYLPQVYPQAFSYLTYRFECALRAAAVLSFVGLGGLGFRIQIALDDLAYSKMWTPIWALIILIAAFDWLSRSAQGYFAR